MKLPVIAAGGIVDAEGVAAALALGAVGIQVGTAYLSCREASTSAIPGAALRELLRAFPLATAAIAALRAKAESQGSGEFSPLWAGQGWRGCRELGAAALTLELARLTPRRAR